MKNFHKITKLLTSIILLCGVTPFLNGQTNININTSSALRKPISPYIYGLNPYHYHNTLTGMALHDAGINVKSLRFGGDAVSTYNWEINSNTSWNSSCGATYFTNENNKFLAYASGQITSAYSNKAGAVLKTISDANAMGAYPLIQISAMQYVAADNDGCISSSECSNAAASGRFKEIVIEKGSALSTTPSTSDNYVYADEEVNYLISQVGLSSSATGVKGYCLENEPGIWSYTHQCAHHQRATCAEIVLKNTNLAKRIKALDPGAETFGPGAYGYAEFKQLNSEGAYGSAGYYPSDWSSYDMTDVAGYNATNYKYMTWLASYLRRMKAASDLSGIRLLDVLDLHFYNEGDNVLQDSRSFWDSSYVENSWITTAVLDGQSYNAGNTFRKLINDFYPGTKLAITEWGNFSNTANPDYGIYTADMLGAFGKQDVYLANYFGRLTGFTAGAYKIFTNYDGANASFKNTSIHTSSSNNAAVTSYASIQNTSLGELHVVLINRTNASQISNIHISSDQNYTDAQVYAMLGSGTGSISTMPGLSGIAGNNFAISLPPKSVYHLVLSGGSTGINQLPTLKSLKVFPNPASNKLTVDLGIATSQKPSFTLLDELGRISIPISQVTNQGNIYELPLPALAAGTYFLQIQFDNYLFTEKVIIQH